MTKTIKIPEDIQEIMGYLAHEFAKTIKHPVYSQEDLFNDLVVLYLENLESGKVKDTSDKNQWFIFFKSQLINKYHSVSCEKRFLERLKRAATL